MSDNASSLKVCSPALRPSSLVRSVQMLSPDGLVVGAGTPDAFTFHTDREVADGLPERLIARARKAGQATATVWRERPDGSPCRMELFVGVLRDQRGSLVGFTRVATEVAETSSIESRANDYDDAARSEADAEREHLTQMLEKATRAAGIVIWEWTIGSDEAHWDNSSFKVFGAGSGLASDTEAADWFARVHPDDRNRATAEVRDAIAGKSVFDTEYRVVERDGTILQYRAVATVVVDASDGADDLDGRIRLVGASWDITDQKNAEAAQARALERLTLAIEAGQFGVWEVDLATGERFWDRRTRELYGIDPSGPSPEYEDWLLTIHPDDRHHMQAAIVQLMEGKSQLTTDFRLFWPNGEMHHLRGLATLVRDGSGAPVRAVGIVSDMTAARIAEAERTEMTNRMKLALQAGRLGIWELNVATGETHWDATVLSHYGLDPSAPMIADDWTTQVHPDDRARVAQAVTETMESPTPTETEFRVVWSDGTVRSLRVLAMAIRDGKAAPPRLVGITQDVTDARTMAMHLEEERRRLVQTVEMWTAAKHAAEEASRAKSEFLTTMSHELRTPLNAILGFGQLLEMDRFGPLTDKQAEYVGAIIHSGTHLRQLIDEILELSTIEAGKIEVSIGHVELAPILKSVVATLSSAAEQRGIVIDARDYGAAAPVVLADRTRLAQALLNLGSNAIKYNRPNGKVTFTCEQIDDDWLRISVIDTGIGIPENRQSELFQPFNRLGAAQLAIEGTGVGLALTRRLVDLMGGRVDFSSVSGQGSRFWIDLPIDTNSAAA